MPLSIEQRNSLKNRWLGIIIIARFYLFLVFLHLLSFLFFSTRVVFLGKPASPLAAAILNLAFIIILFFLYWAVKYLKKIGLWTAMIFHFFFLTNSLFLFFKETPLLNIEGQKLTNFLLYKEQAILISTLLNVSIILYLFYRKDCFGDYRKRG